MAPKPPLDVKIEIRLDDEEKTYYPGDAVEGKIFITSNQSYTVSDLRLAWTGRIQVQPVQTNADNRIYFDERWQLSEITKAPRKTTFGKNNVTYYNTHLILTSEGRSAEPKVELSKNKPAGFAFKVYVPNDRPLPSSTGNESPFYKIMYLLEAFFDTAVTSSEKPVFFAQRSVHVLEAIYTRSVELMKPQRVEQVFTLSPSNQDIDFTTAVQVTLPCRGCQPGIVVPVSISIWNNVEFSRKQGISISLFRVNQINANGRAYTSAAEKIHRVITDLNISIEDHDRYELKMQAVRIGLPIPKGITPTITLEKSELLLLNYFIRVQVFAQEGVYTASDGARLQFMLVDVPFLVGTQAESTAKLKSPTPSLASPKINKSSLPFLTSPTLSKASSPSLASPKISVASPTPMASPRTPTESLESSKSSNTDTPKSPTVSQTSSLASPRSSGTFAPSSIGAVNSYLPKASLVTSAYASRGEMVSKAASGTTDALALSPRSSHRQLDRNSILTAASGDSQSSDSTVNSKKKAKGGLFRNSSMGDTPSEDGKKKKTFFSSFRSYNKRKSNSTLSLEAPSVNDLTITENKEMEDQATLSVTNQSKEKMTNIYPDEKPKEAPIKAPTQAPTGVFNMFPDDDSDEEDILENKKAIPAKERVFNMFPDSDDSDEDESGKECSLSIKDNPKAADIRELAF